MDGRTNGQTKEWLIHRAVKIPSKPIKTTKIISLEIIKFMFSKKATNIDKIFTVDLTFTIYCQIDGEDIVNFCGLLRKHELY